MKDAFYDVILSGPESIQRCFAARFNSDCLEDNFNKDLQKTFIIAMQEIFEHKEYIRTHRRTVGTKYKIGANCDFVALKKFILEDPTVKRLEEEFGIKVFEDENIVDEDKVPEEQEQDDNSLEALKGLASIFGLHFTPEGNVIYNNTALGVSFANGPACAKKLADELGVSLIITDHGNVVYDSSLAGESSVDDTL